MVRGGADAVAEKRRSTCHFKFRVFLSFHFSDQLASSSSATVYDTESRVVNEKGPMYVSHSF